MKHKTILILLFLTCISVYLPAKDRNEPIKKENMDTSVSPANDFYLYANGTWLKNNPIPDDYTRWGTFEVLEKENDKKIQAILTDASEKSLNAEKGTIIQQVGDFFYAAMDSAEVEKAGITPLKPYFSEIEKISTSDDVISYICKIQKFGLNPLFDFNGDPDLKNSNMVVAYLEQDGLGLPDRDYYLNQDEKTKEIRSKYLVHLQNMFKLTGRDNETAQKIANTILSLETQLAENSFTRLENRDPYKVYNKMSIDSLAKICPAINWKNYFSALNLNDLNEIIVGQPKFFAGLSTMLNNTPAQDWKLLFEWYILRTAAAYVSSEFVNENFSFYGAALKGQKAMQPRWNRATDAINNFLGDAVGQLYVKVNFPPEAKERARTLVMNLLGAMKERILALTWMTDETKKAALKKLSTFVVKIGYTDKWEDYTGYEATRKSYIDNVLNAIAFHFNKDLNEIGKPYDKVKWSMNAQEVNAYYSSVKNEIAFPAAILQPPFFDAEADDAVNYGAIGAAIGHEITHGFDHRGRQYDHEGNLKDWWTEEDNKQFGERAKVIIDQYNNYAVVDTNKVDGEFTQGENIADLGGLYVSFTAFKKTSQYKDNTLIDGFTPAQRFFLGFAQVWRNNIRDEAQLLRLKTDVHSPGKVRVNGPLSNMPEFWEAFNIPQGTPMRNPENKLVKIW